MFLVLTASADTYITNKIVGSIRTTDANVGRAGTIDIFKLYSENKIASESNPIELSRGLIKFDMQPVRDLTASVIDIGSNSFKATMQLYDIAGGNTQPKDYNLVCYPLSQSFDEGLGRDVATFGDLDRANFITASYAGGQTFPWFVSGANAQGTLGSPSIDVIVNGNLGSGVVDFAAKQHLPVGNENLNIDVTTLVSGIISQQIPDHGFRLSFSGSEETDQKTRFVKRFASRHSSNRSLHPKILISYDDSIRDDTNNLYFDVSGSVYLNNYVRNDLANLVSGSSLTAITGNNSLIMKLETGSYTKFVTASQLQTGTGFKTGVYVANFAISSTDATTFSSSSISGTMPLSTVINKSGSLVFNQYWQSLDGTQAFSTGTLKISKLQPSSNTTPKDLDFIATNVKDRFTPTDVHRFRIFVRDLNANRFASKFPLRLKSIIPGQAYYSVYDKQTRKVVVPYLESNNGTKLSSDSDGLYFDMYMQGLPPGRRYGLKIKTTDFGQTSEYDLKNVAFTVE